MSLCNAADFFIPEFQETAKISNVNYRCIQSELKADENYTNYGQEDGATIFLDFVLADLPILPDAGDRITFRSIVYRVVKTTIDSANLTVKIGCSDLTGTGM
jgi:hypothetical protein